MGSEGWAVQEEQGGKARKGPVGAQGILLALVGLLRYAFGAV